MDTHADTCVLGPNFKILHYTGRECDVLPYTEVFESVKSVPIVSSATAWTDENTGVTYFLLSDEGLWMPDTVSASLINPNQIRAHGITVQDNPFAGPMSIISDEDAMCVPMVATGTNICVKTRTPTQEELDTCTHVHLTSDREWEPKDVKFPQMSAIRRDVFLDEESVPGEISNVLGFTQRLITSVRISTTTAVRDVPIMPTFQTEERRSDVTPERLADHWMIGLETARRTLRQTTQRFKRSALLPLSRRYKTDRIYQLPRLKGEWLTDRIDDRCKSRDGNSYGQIFANESYLAVFYPIDSKSKAGDALGRSVRSWVFLRSSGLMGARNRQGRTQNSRSKSASMAFSNMYLNHTCTI
jgi:hypothetical protein